MAHLEGGRGELTKYPSAPTRTFRATIRRMASDDYYAAHRGICDKCCICSIESEKIGSKCEHCKTGTIVYDAPWSERHDKLPEPMTCGRRQDTWAGSRGLPVHGERSREVGQDHWQKHKSNGDRVCSFCGSLHPDDFFRLVHEAAIAPEDADRGTVVDIETTDKSYKVYVHQPGVRNAYEGGIKFYIQHLPRKEDGSVDVTLEQEAEFNEAVRRSRARFERFMQVQFPKPGSTRIQ